MNENIVLTLAEIFISLIIEGVILSMVFTFIANKSSEKQNTHLKQEMANIETQNKFTHEQVLATLEKTKTEIINQIKESEAKK